MTEAIAPNFLVIGAMKSGTTTLYEDLRLHPGVYIPDKETSILLASERTSETQHTFRDMYRRRPSGAILGEVSATYAMLPTFPGVPKRAHATLGPETKIVYLVREPLDRIISHHFHDLADGRIGSEIDVAVREDARFVSYSSYGLQLAPWIDAFGSDAVRVVRFEEYMSDRASGLRDILTFLGVPLGVKLDPTEVFNASDGKSVAPGRWGRVAGSVPYRRWLRPLIPTTLRKRAVRAVLPTAPARPAPPQNHTVDWLLEQLSDDILALGRLTASPPWWDVDQLRNRHYARSVR